MYHFRLQSWECWLPNMNLHRHWHEWHLSPVKTNMMNKQWLSLTYSGTKKPTKVKTYPVLGKQQVYGCIGNDVHAQFKGQDLSGFSWCGNITHFHWLKVCRQEEFPKTVSVEMDPEEYLWDPMVMRDCSEQEFTCANAFVYVQTSVCQPMAHS